MESARKLSGGLKVYAGPTDVASAVCAVRVERPNGDVDECVVFNNEGTLAFGQVTQTVKKNGVRFRLGRYPSQQVWSGEVVVSVCEVVADWLKNGQGVSAPTDRSQ